MKAISFIFIFLLSISSMAQQVIDIEKRDFEKGEAGFREAWGYVKDGLFYMGEGTIEGAEVAIDAFLKASLYNSDCPALNFNLAQAYTKTRQYKKAYQYFDKVYRANPDLTPTLLFSFAKSQHMNGLYAEAFENFKKFLVNIPTDYVDELTPEVKKKIEECKNGIALKDKALRAHVENLGPNINTSYSEHSPVISADNTVMYFTSRRPLYQDAKRDKDGKYFENIFKSEYLNGEWQLAKPVGEPLNTDDHDATIGLAPDGQKMFVFRAKSNGDIYISKLTGNTWGKAEKVKGKVNSSKKESSACFSFDGKELFFVSSNKLDGALGGSDIYVSTQDEKGRWNNPKNLGATVNTKFNEEQVFMMPDGRTLYFSSQGHNTMGGYDIFKTERDEDGVWSEPENIGPPVNTPGDDIFYVAAANGKYAYYSSAAEGGIGGADIYKVTYLSPQNPLVMDGEDNLIASLTEPVKEQVDIKPMKLKTIRLTILKGLIQDSITKQPVAANIEIVDNEKNVVVFTSESNSATGRYLISLPSGKNYGIAVHQEGYLFHSENFEIPPAQNYTEIEKNISLLSIAVGSKVILKNIFFDTGKASLRSTSEPEINRIAEFLKRYPKVTIQINGHTDNVGGTEANQTLSNKRANAVVEALVAKGISNDQLKAVGFGETQPIASNKTSKGRQENRRVEFEILSQ